ncbi:hypothetical protein CORC01_14299 [Colletotrichum orchidophilum]|uniref:Glycosyl transferase n=1 Tax=Colletotrichum orchidophilum TaxID=1209926 RepID=A0A1G4AMJ5_9PEZI|nr:uncharacterized protein CORC01_14299 [Colletotrichum orchidophilum]OHE90408.1 hypothetical protein CORC01_14299 [Colletotrichum orchidophilum]
MYSAWYYFKPHTIYLHTNADDEKLECARNGTYGRWAMHMFAIPGLKVNWMEAPHETNLGVKLTFKEHISDFMRVKAVHDFGGVYVDFDVQALRDVAGLRTSGFNAIGGRQLNHEMNSGTFMSKKGGKMVKLWMENMHKVYNGGWTTHSNWCLTKVAESLVQEPGEVLILDRQAFAPIGWNAEDAVQLFGLHNKSTSLEEGATDLQSRSDDEHVINWQVDRPSWPYDWSASYLLHSFTPDWNVVPVEGVYDISPHYVWERRSNYAQATYTVVKDMYLKGILSPEDIE